LLLKRLSEAFGVSGYETEVREIITNELKSYVDEIKTDSMGNLYAIKRAYRQGPIVMLCSHMDEIGMMITAIEKNGLLKFKVVGGIDQRTLVSKTVKIGKHKIGGVIGAKAIHLQEPEERKKALKSKDLYIDIGAKDKEEAESLVKIGDFATFDSIGRLFGENLFKGKALDNRAGNTVLVDVLKAERTKLPIFGVFTVQEEIGLRGSAIAANFVKPDLAVVLETTHAADTPETESYESITSLGNGPALTVMDMTFIRDKKLLGMLIKTAERKGIPYQFKRAVSGGTDAGRIHISQNGVPTVIISIPCRYLHSASSVVNLNDIDNTLKLTLSFLNEL
jgi:putative aminopeptidase FrvX